VRDAVNLPNLIKTKLSESFSLFLREAIDEARLMRWAQYLRIVSLYWQFTPNGRCADIWHHDINQTTIRKTPVLTANIKD